MIQDNEGVIELLQRMAEDNAAQNKYLRKQLLFTRVFAISCCVLTAVLLAVMLKVMPPLLGTMDKAVLALDQASQTLTTVDDTLLDIQGLFEPDGLVGQSSDALKEATDKISRMDIDSLNEAISDLGDVVEPMADFFNKFRR